MVLKAKPVSGPVRDFLNTDRTAFIANWSRIIMAGKGAWVVENIRVFQCGRMDGEGIGLKGDRAADTESVG